MQWASTFARTFLSERADGPQRRYPAAAPRASGFTLMELLIVLVLISLIIGLTFPAFSSGIDYLRLGEATDEIVSFFNEALDRAERRQEFVEVTISQTDNTLALHSSDPSFERRLVLSEGIKIARVLPEAAQDDTGMRRIALYPGGAAPRFGIEIVNVKNQRRVVRVDPITGVPQVEEGPAQSASEPDRGNVSSYSAAEER